MDFRISFRPSGVFAGVVAGLNGSFYDWTDGSDDWGDQVPERVFTPRDFPADLTPDKILATPLGQQALVEIERVMGALLRGEHPLVQHYLKGTRYIFVVGFPRSGGSYLTKELVRGIGLESRDVPNALGHDGYPNLMNHWFEQTQGLENSYLQQGLYQLAEFLVLSRLFYERKARRAPNGLLMIPKKMHKAAFWGGSLKMLLGQGGGAYLITVRHPAPTCVSIYEKSGGLPADGRFPALAPRSAIESWILNDLYYLGHSIHEIAAMPYFEAVLKAWVNFYMRLPASGLMMGSDTDTQVVTYGRQSLESTSETWKRYLGHPDPVPETVVLNTGHQRHPEWLQIGNAAVQCVMQAWAQVGLKFPPLDLV